MSPLSFLVDTDCVIDHFNRIRTASERIKKAASEGLGLSVISLAELSEGIFFSRDPVASDAQVQEFMGGITLIGISGETCRIFGRLRGELRPRGRLVPDFDLMIAATAIEHNLTLLSNNRRHFENIPGLRLESI